MISFEEIKKVLPQKYPYYMVDKIVELKERERVVGIKNITGNDIHFLGHFPEVSIFPGAMIIESIAQISTFLFYSRKSKQKLKFLLGVIKEARFFKTVFPGDQLKVTVTVIRITKNNAYIHALVSVENNKVAEGEMIFVKRNYL